MKIRNMFVLCLVSQFYMRQYRGCTNKLHNCANGLAPSQACAFTNNVRYAGNLVN